MRAAGIAHESRQTAVAGATPALTVLLYTPSRAELLLQCRLNVCGVQGAGYRADIGAALLRGLRLWLTRLRTLAHGWVDLPRV